MAVTTLIYGNKTADGDFTANSFIKSGATADDILLGNGTTTSLAALSGATQLDELSDVTSATPTDKYVLVANGTNWASRALVTADISDWATQVEAYITDVTAKGLLENTANWSIDGAYTGTAITGTFQGQKHFDTAYFFEAYDDNLWLRLPRG